MGTLKFIKADTTVLQISCPSDQLKFIKQDSTVTFIAILNI